MKEPAGLNKKDDEVNVGVSAKEKGQNGGDRRERWEVPTAKLKKDGEVIWTVKLEVGGVCRLALEWEVENEEFESVVTT